MTTTATEFRQMAATARDAGDLTQAARYERKAKTAPEVVEPAICFHRDHCGATASRPCNARRVVR